MKKQQIFLLCLLPLFLVSPDSSHAAQEKVLVADFSGDGRLGDLGTALSAVCRSALGPSSVPAGRTDRALRSAGLDPARGIRIPGQDVTGFADTAGATRLVSGRLFVSPTGTRLVLRFLDREGRPVGHAALNAPDWQAWPSLVRATAREVTRQAGLEAYTEPPEALRPSLESYGGAVRAWAAGRWDRAVDELGLAHRQNPAMTRYLEQSGKLAENLARKAKTKPDKARLLLETGRSREAARLLSPLARRAGGDPNVLLLYATALRESGRPEKAVQVLKSGAKSTTENLELQIALARARSAAGSPGEAAAGLEQVTGPAPENPEAALALAEAMQAGGQGKAAAVLSTAAGNALAYQGRLNSANEALLSAMAQDPSRQENLQELEPAFLTMDQARAVQAQLMKELDGSALEGPDRLYAQGMLLPREGREEEANLALAAYLATNPDHGPAHGEMGRLLAAAGRHEEAVQHLEPAPGEMADTETLMRMALEYQAMGQPHRSLAAMDRIDTAAGDPHVQALIQQSVLHLETGNIPEAKHTIDRVIDLQPDNAAAHRVKARILGASGWAGGATLEMRTAARLDPGGLEVPYFSPEGSASFQGTALQAPLVPHAEELSEALFDLLKSFEVLAERPREMRRAIWVAVEVKGLEHQPFFQLFRLSPQRLARDAAWVLSAKMGYPDLVSSRVMPVTAPDESREVVLADLIRQGATLGLVLTMQPGEEPKIEARVYDTASGGEWKNAAWVDPISLSAMEEINRPFLAVLTAPFTLAILVFLVLWIRGTGTLVVEEEHDSGVERAFFSVLISRRKLGPPLKKGDELSYLETVAAKGREKSRYSANLVGRHTVFEKLPPRSFYVYFYGVLVDAGVPIGSYSLEKAVRVRRRRREHVKFDLTPREATIHVQAMFQGTACYGAEVWVNEDRHHSVYTKDGTRGGVDGALIRLPRGEYTICVAFRDRTVSQEVSIQDMSRQSVFVEIEQPDRHVH